MTWIAFIMGALLLFGTIVADSPSIKGNIIQTIWMILAAIIMFVAIYMRSLGW
ncbi:hypothetical protein phiOC_p077 [Ochrobactrum phage vB_OspM_OC]|nr:hypothetical protein phiOC_p077 [Ochrobactrum phage vB_OspM_OC]